MSGRQWLVIIAGCILGEILLGWSVIWSGFDNIFDLLQFGVSSAKKYPPPYGDAAAGAQSGGIAVGIVLAAGLLMFLLARHKKN